eukprot:s1269_g2.t1
MFLDGPGKQINYLPSLQRQLQMMPGREILGFPTVSVLGDFDWLNDMPQDCQIWEVGLERIESSLGNRLQGPDGVALRILGDHGNSIHIGFAMPRDDILQIQGAICRGQI